LVFDGATVTAILPHCFAVRPFALDSLRSLHVAPPSVVLNSPLALGAVSPSPPERKVHPFRRKSHIPAYTVFGFFESIDIIEQPVYGLDPLRILVQLCPPLVVL
jgi:hypothetical protein